MVYIFLESRDAVLEDSVYHFTYAFKNYLSSSDIVRVTMESCTYKTPAIVFDGETIDGEEVALSKHYEDASTLLADLEDYFIAISYDANSNHFTITPTELSPKLARALGCLESHPGGECPYVVDLAGAAYLKMFATNYGSLNVDNLDHTLLAILHSPGYANVKQTSQGMSFTTTGGVFSEPCLNILFVDDLNRRVELEAPFTIMLSFDSLS